MGITKPKSLIFKVVCFFSNKQNIELENYPLAIYFLSKC
jgi:hypothetical protein